MMAKLKTFWESRNAREQKILGIGAVVGIILIGYEFIWSPLNTKVAELQRDVANKQTLVTWLQAASTNITELRTAGVKPQTRITQPLLTFIDQEALHSNLSTYLSKVSQPNTNQVLLNFDSVPFDVLITWLQNLWKKNGIGVFSLSLKPLSTEGMVQVQVVLTQQ